MRHLRNKGTLAAMTTVALLGVACDSVAGAEGRRSGILAGILPKMRLR